MAGRHYHHGNSPAAWTAVVIIFVGFGVGSAFTVMAEPLGVLGGALIVALGGVVGLVMRAMGLGQAPAPIPVTRAAASVLTEESVPAQPTGEERSAAVSG
jgi:hypothetical protein